MENPNLEKTIRGLECCILRDPDDHARCSQCSYSGNCVNRLKMDALKLLKSDDLVKVIRCKDCQMWRSPSEEDISDGITTGYCNNAGFGTEPFEFCSDAIRR